MRQRPDVVRLVLVYSVTSNPPPHDSSEKAEYSVNIFMTNSNPMEPPSGFTKDGDHAEYSDMIHDASTDGNSTTEHRASVNPTQPPSVRRALGYSDSSSTQNPSSKEPLPSLADRKSVV